MSKYQLVLANGIPKDGTPVKIVRRRDLEGFYVSRRVQSDSNGRRTAHYVVENKTAFAGGMKTATTIAEVNRIIERVC